MDKDELVYSRKEFDTLQAENERLKKAGWYMYQSLSDLGRLSKPDTEDFTPDHDFKVKVLSAWTEALQGKPATNPTCKKCKYETIPCEWKGERPCSAFTPKPSREAGEGE